MQKRKQTERVVRALRSGHVSCLSHPKGRYVRRAVEAGVKLVCSTDAHSIRGLGNMELAVATARRGWATAADVLNTRPLDSLLAGVGRRG